MQLQKTFYPNVQRRCVFSMTSGIQLCPDDATLSFLLCCRQMTSVIKSKVNILLIVVPDLGGGLGGHVVSMIYEESKSQLITEMVMIMGLFIRVIQPKTFSSQAPKSRLIFR